MKQVAILNVIILVSLFCFSGSAFTREKTFCVEDVIRSAEVIRTVYKDVPTVYLYQGNGEFGSSFGRLGLHLHPLQKNGSYGKTQYLHLEHRGRGKFNHDYLLPMLEIYWKEPFSAVSQYSQCQSYYDGVIATSFCSGNEQVKVTTWFDPVEKELGYITAEVSHSGREIVVAPYRELNVHYGQHLHQSVDVRPVDGHWEITLQCLNKQSTLYFYTNAEVTEADGKLVLSLRKGKNYIRISYNTPSNTSDKVSLKQTCDWWHQTWERSGCLLIPDDKAQKTWVRSMAMFLSSYSERKKGLAPPMGYTGNWWPFYYPQDVSYVHPVLLQTGNLDIAKSWIERWSSEVEGIRQYTHRLYGVEGVLAPWVYPYDGFEGYHVLGPPNKFFYEIHNSGYFARMACETAVFVDDEAWTDRYVRPIVEGTAEFYANICTKGTDGLWHLYVKPSMGQDERGGENQRDYLCAMYSAQYCLQQALKMGIDPQGRYSQILREGLAFKSLLSPRGFYYSCAGSGEKDFGKQKHPVQLNELAFLPVNDRPSASAAMAYGLRYEITQDARKPYFYGWTLGEFLLAGSRMGMPDEWKKDWMNMEPSGYVDEEWIQIYETSHNLTTPFYNITNGLVAQSLLNNLVCDWYGKLEIGKCNPWKGKAYVKGIRSQLGVIVDGKVEASSYDVTLTAWKDTEFVLDGETIALKKGEKVRRHR